MSGRVAEAGAISALALILTLALAAPVLQAPSDRLFGKEVVGRHHDPFTAMQQFTRSTAQAVHQQPLTDGPGALLARALGPVAAYNALILLAFPLSAAAAYALARHLALSRAAATVAALAFAFSPFHIAHGAYHPHIAQTQWLPLYLLALWRCLDGASPAAVTLLVVATVGVTLSNFYGGLIAAVVTPAAMGAYWLVRTRRMPGSTRSIAVTTGTLLALGLGAVACAWYVGHMAVTDGAALAVPRDDLFRYGATWRGYLVPPVAHPLFGSAAGRLWQAAGVQEGLLEQQLTLGWGFLVLGLVAVQAWLAAGTSVRPLAAVPVLLAVAAVALASSLPPEAAVGPFRLAGVSALLHPVVPMFRAYARFGMVVQLMVALLAAIGAACLWSRGTRRARTVCAMLLTLGAVEYAVWPPTLWRHALPTAAHRWVVAHRAPMRVLDCAALTPETESIQWLTRDRITMRHASFPDCTHPGIGASLLASGYSHILVRRHAPEGQWFATRDVPDGLRLVARFDDGDVLAVAAQASPVQTLGLMAFHPRERNHAWTWRWMRPAARWAILNPGGRTIHAMLDVEMMAFNSARRLQVLVDGVAVQTLTIEARRRVVPLGPFVLTPGAHELAFHPVDPPTIADDVLRNHDPRPLSIAVGAWHWTTAGPRL